MFHASSGVLEVWAFLQGAGAAIWGNVALRVIVVAALWFWGLRPLGTHTSR